MNEAAALPITAGSVVPSARSVLRPPPTPTRHHTHFPDHPARIMTTTPLLDPRQPQRQRARQPKLVGHLRQQRAACVRHQTRSVRSHIYGYRAPIAHHLQGEPPQARSSTPAKPKNRCTIGRFRAPARRGCGRHEATTARSGLVCLLLGGREGEPSRVFHGEGHGRGEEPGIAAPRNSPV